MNSKITSQKKSVPIKWNRLLYLDTDEYSSVSLVTSAY